jgi:EAL domain-containing protein (putative c-di-GMP-specific phosphodiesterase class I)/CheY-like chemotaxis protein
MIHSADRDSGAATILVIDDDPLLLSTLELILEEHGYQVRLAEDGLKGLHSVRAARPDLVITDLSMPVKDGLDTIRLLRRWSPDLKIILMSGRAASSELAAKAAELGVNAVLRKPFDDDRLIAAVAGCLAGQAGPIGAAGSAGPRLTAAELAAAIAADQLFLEYQPKLDCRLGRIIGVEALLRWTHPVHGIVRPDEIIALAENSGLIGRLTQWVLAAAAKQAAQWRAEGLILEIAVNISEQDLADRNLPDRLGECCRSAGIEPSLVILELTETSALREAEAAMNVLTRLRFKGFRLSIDDFGAGYSLLQQLHRLPFTEMKIDNSFVAQLMGSAEARRTVKNAVDLAHKLDLTTVAEGVENESELAVLRELGCDAAQGYFLSRPVPAGRVAEIARRFDPATAEPANAAAPSLAAVHPARNIVPATTAPTASAPSTIALPASHTTLGRWFRSS